MGVDLVVLALAAMDCFHIESMSQYKGNSLSDTKVSYPVPGEHALRCHHNVLPVGSNKLKKCVGIRIQVPVSHNLSTAAEYAHIHFLCVQVDSTIIFVLFGVESHLVSSLDGFCYWCSKVYHPFEEALHSINGMHRTAKAAGDTYRYGNNKE